MNTKSTKVLSIILGLFLIVYAANQFIHVFPTSYGNMPEFTESYLDGIAPFLPALYIFEIIMGLLLVFNIWNPLLLIILAPLTINFLIFNVTNLIVDIADSSSASTKIGTVWPAALVAILNIILIIQYRNKYRPLLHTD